MMFHLEFVEILTNKYTYLMKSDIILITLTRRGIICVV